MAQGTILDEATVLTSGDRKEAYGSARESFTRTGKMWGALLHLDRDVTPEEVALCFIAHKMSRESHKGKRDNRVDIAGYARLLDDIATTNEQYDDALTYPGDASS